MHRKKIVATVLSLAMVFSMLPVSVFAEETEDGTEEVSEVTETVEEEEETGEVSDEEVSEETEESEESDTLSETDITEEAEETEEQIEVEEKAVDSVVEAKVPAYNEQNATISWSEFEQGIADTPAGGIYFLEADVVRGEGYSNEYNIVIDKQITIDLNDHTIDSSLNYYGTFRITSGNVKICNGTILGNTHQYTYCVDVYGSGVVVSLENLSIKGFESAIKTDVPLSITDCSITDNTNAFYQDFDNELITLNGKVIINNNEYSNINLSSGKVLNISNLTSGSKIGIGMSQPGAFTGELSSDLQDLKSCFFSTDTNYYVALEDSKFVLKSTSFDVTNWNELYTAINTIPVKGYVRLMNDCVASSGSSTLKITSGKDITIDLNGYSIDRNKKGRVFENEGKLTFVDNSVSKNGKITGGLKDYTGAGIYNEGTLRLSGGSITGNYLKYDDGLSKAGAGIYNKGGNVYIDGGSITDNNTGNVIVDGHYEGGGIYNSEGRVYFYSGTISGNHAHKGAGIYNYKGFIRLYGSPVLSGNIASNDDGATYGGTTFGGAIYNLEGEVNIEGGTFTDNFANDGAAIFNADTLTIDGATFTGNNATVGAAIYNGCVYQISDGSATIKNAQFSSNAATTAGGAIYNDSIKNNMTIEDAVFMENRTTSTNSDYGNGGAIFNGGVLNITSDTQTSSSVFKNGCGANSANNGGAVYNSGSGTLNITNWIATQNSAAKGGAIYNKGSLLLKGIEIGSNTATGNGGGIYLDSDLTIDGSIIINNNKKDEDANNLYLGSNKVVFPDKVSLTDDSVIGITYDVDTGNSSYEFTNGYYRTAKGDVSYFVSDSSRNIICLRESTSAITPDEELEIHTYQPNYITYFNLSLNGDIATNVYFKPADDLDAAASLVKVTGPNGVEMHSLSEIITDDNYTEDYGYKITYPVFARQMYETVKFEFAVKDTSGNNQTIYYELQPTQSVQGSKIEFSVYDYTSLVLNSVSGLFSAEEVKLIDALDVYCKLACIQFGTAGNYISLDDLGLDNSSRKNNVYTSVTKEDMESYNRTLDTESNSVEDCRFDVEGGDPVYQNIGYAGMSFVDYSKPALRLYFTADIRTADFEVSLSKDTLTWGNYTNRTHDPLTSKASTGVQDGLYYIEIPGILFDDFDRMIYVHFCTDRYRGDKVRHTCYRIGACPLSYAYLISKNDSNAGTVMYYFAKAMYVLNKDIEAYKGE